MKRDNLANPRSENSEWLRRTRDARRAATAENSSISRGRTRVLNAAGDPVAALGHINGKSGLLLVVGGQWRTVQEHIDARITSAAEWHEVRITNLEALGNNLGPRVATAEGDIAAIPGMITASHAYPTARIVNLEALGNNLGPRMGAAEGDISTLEGRVNSHGSRIGRAEDEIGKVITAINQLKERVGDLDGGSKAPVPPNPKG